MSRPVVALLTDFGLRDHYVGTMKGVVLDICPDAALVDISHDVPCHDVTAGAFELAAAFRFFPAGTVFLCVVDPGVGSSRKGLAVEAGMYRFVAPDNGLLSPVVDEISPHHIVELVNQQYARPTISPTFEGRDRFAPAAAWLAMGVAISSLGPVLKSIERLAVSPPRLVGDRLVGEVRRVDRFGNLVTSIDRETLARLIGPADATHCDVHVGEHRLSGIVSCYADVNEGELCALFGSTNHLEIASRGRSAAAELSLGLGAVVHVTRRA